MIITSDGNVGIGTSDPKAPLHVYTYKNLSVPQGELTGLIMNNLSLHLTEIYLLSQIILYGLLVVV